MVAEKEVTFMAKKKKFVASILFVISLIILSPIDDIVFAAVFGTVLFEFGSTEWFLLIILTSIIGFYIFSNGKKTLKK